MLFDYVETDLNVQLLFGLALGVFFGVAAQVSRFCLRRGVAGDDGADRPALAVWLLALGTAMGAVQLATATGFAELGEHRFLSSDLPVMAIVLGGLTFGAGMVLTRGCISRLTVLSATGNLRAATVLILFALVAHAMMKGVLTPLRTGLSGFRVELPFGSFAALPGASVLIPLVVLGAALWLGHRSRARVLHLGLGAFIGLLIALGWVGTSTLLMDEFDPAPVQSLAFTLPWTDGLFWGIASTAVPAGFGVGLVGGVLLGAFLSAALRGELALVSFSDPRETLRYVTGGALMAAGGTLAGGCSVGAGLSGFSTLGVLALLTLVSIILGAVAMRHMMSGNDAGRKLRSFA
ncbi:MAG: YeeE/YedE family protein [Rhodobacterales bacterium]|nr:MAG: YeeE/YedE family protein [Rhodobacterales bacterium]